MHLSPIEMDWNSALAALILKKIRTEVLPLFSSWMLSTGPPTTRLSLIIYEKEKLFIDLSTKFSFNIPVFVHTLHVNNYGPSLPLPWAVVHNIGSPAPYRQVSYLIFFALCKTLGYTQFSDTTLELPPPPFWCTAPPENWILQRVSYLDTKYMPSSTLDCISLMHSFPG